MSYIPHFEVSATPLIVVTLHNRSLHEVLWLIVVCIVCHKLLSVHIIMIPKHDQCQDTLLMTRRDAHLLKSQLSHISHWQLDCQIVHGTSLHHLCDPGLTLLCEHVLARCTHVRHEHKCWLMLQRQKCCQCIWYAQRTDISSH